jgi:hypothetical protein
VLRMGGVSERSRKRSKMCSETMGRILAQHARRAAMHADQPMLPDGNMGY